MRSFRIREGLSCAGVEAVVAGLTDFDEVVCSGVEGRRAEVGGGMGGGVLLKSSEGNSTGVGGRDSRLGGGMIGGDPVTPSKAC